MQYSPKLKKAMEEIKNILKKNDIAGMVILHNIEGEAQVNSEGTHVQGFTEFLFHINTTYSATSFENDRFIVKGKSIHYPSKTDRDKKMSGAVNMLEHLSKWSGMMALNAFEMNKRIGEIVEKLDSGDGETTSTSQQNN